MKLSVVAIGKDFTQYPYLSKLIDVLSSNGNVEYIYWNRGGSEKTVENISYKELLYSLPVNKTNLIVGYIKWIFNIFKYIIKSDTGNTIFFTSRFDSALPFCIASIFSKKIEYVYLDRDCYHMTYSLGFFKPIIKKIESIVGKRSLVHLVPGKSRDFTGFNNVVVVPNTPSHALFLEAKNRAKVLKKSSTFTIYINGWLVETRGANMILKALEMFNSSQIAINFLVAGPVKCSNINKLLEFDFVTYLGELNAQDSLSYYFVSDLVFAFYDPSIEINRFAEPNKWYDCVFSNTKFVTNKGLLTSSQLEDVGLAHTVQYGDFVELFKLILKLMEENSKLNKEILENLGYQFWDVKVREIIEQLVSNKK